MNPTEKPLIFQSFVRQRMMAALARTPFLRIGDAVKYSGGTFPNKTEFANFEATGLVIRFGTDRSRLIALNAGFPGSKSLRALLLCVDCHPHEQAIKAVWDEPAPISPPDRCNPSEIFGSRHQTTAILAICLAGGSLRVKHLRDILIYDGAMANHISHVTAALVARGMIVVDKDVIRLADTVPKAELIAFARDLTNEHPILQRLIYKAPKTSTIVKPGGYYDWKGPQYGADRPKGPGLGTDGSPQLFRSNARFRTLIALAMYQPIPPTDVRRTAHIGAEVFSRMVDEGTVIVSKQRGARSFSLAQINPAIPAYDELLAFLQKLAEQWPPRPATAKTTKLLIQPEDVPWTVPIDKYFGTQTRSTSLLMLAKLGKADPATLARSLPAHDRPMIAHAVRMFQYFGIVRFTGVEGNAHMFELDPSWFAARELKTLLDALLTVDQRYEGRANSVDAQMPDHRKAMKDNESFRKRNPLMVANKRNRSREPKAAE